MDVSDYRILQFIYLVLENTKLERQQMSPFQFRRLIVEALQSRKYTVIAFSGAERLFIVNRLVLLYFPYEIEKDENVRSFLMNILHSGKSGDMLHIAYSVRNGMGVCVLRIERPEL